MTPRSATAARRGRAPSAPASAPDAPAWARGSGTAGTRKSGRRAAPERRQRAAHARRRPRVLGLLVLFGLLGILAVSGLFSGAVQEIALPLRHEDIIRQQAADKRLDPALVAGVIYVESHFRDGQRSSAGAEGLMQLTPDTARYIARKSGGSAFRLADLATPQVNIAYGSYYLRYLLDRYDANETLALAAYNGGEGNVDRWRAVAARRGDAFSAASIPFAETRDYVERVAAAKRSYRRQYARELGL